MWFSCVDISTNSSPHVNGAVLKALFCFASLNKHRTQPSIVPFVDVFLPIFAVSFFGHRQSRLGSTTTVVRVLI